MKMGGAKCRQKGVEMQFGAGRPVLAAVLLDESGCA